MSNPTSNFNWQMPTASDLVTDLPADFETFGQAVDTTLAELKGGTTGQVLSKTSNTDMDFTWVAQDDSNAIQNAIVDAKGDLIAASAADTPARLAVGNNGETLVADSSTSTGLRYIPATIMSNPTINSCFDVWQRGTSFSLSASSGVVYTADRWSTATGANQACTISRQATSDTTNLPNVQYAYRWQRNSGQTGTGTLTLVNLFETTNSIPFIGKTVTYSFYARSGANFSGTIRGTLYTGTGTDQSIWTGFTSQSSVIDTVFTPTTTWQRFTFSVTLASTVTQLATGFNWMPSGTAGAADYVEVTGVQLDIGSVALPVRRNAATIQGELAACQRYYVRLTNGGASEGLGPVGSAFSTTGVTAQFVPSVPLRVLPTVLEVVNCRLYDGVTVYAVTSATISGSQPGQVLQADANVASGLTQYRYYRLIANSGASYVGFGAEL
jgi:hypothetical protein